MVRWRRPILTTTTTTHDVQPVRPPHRQPAPTTREGSLATAVLRLQRLAGNSTVASLVRSGRIGTPVQRDRTVTPTKKTDTSTFNNIQYRVSGSGDPRLIEVVERRTRRDGTPYYLATGTVTGFAHKKPIVSVYDQPKDLGNWAPRVTHVNGMGVMPESGMKSAEALLASVQSTIAKAGDDVAVDPDVIDVLYTYSAKRSSFVSDVFNCLKGKLQVEDSVTGTQEQTMLDAVAARRRIHVSAHSRGTIKTDNAVRNAFTTLAAEYTARLRSDQGVRRAARKLQQDLIDTGLMDSKMALAFAIESVARARAEDEVKADMNRYIQLVYGGNAVSYPSSVLPVELFVGSMDFVSLGVGTYTNWGAGWASGNKGTKLHKQSGGHGYTQNYAKPVGEAIGKDLEKTAVAERPGGVDARDQEDGEEI